MSLSQKSIHHSFDIHIATEYGVEEALLIHHFQHWITINMKMKRNIHEGNCWTYQTLDEIAAHFPYMTKERVFNLLEKLCTGKSRFSKKGKSLEIEPVLKKGNFNKSKYDRTVWYAFCDYTKWILCEHKMEIGETQNGNGGSTTPIPHAIPDAKPVSINIDTYEAPEGPRPSDPECAVESFGKHVKLTRKEYGELSAQHGKNQVDEMIESVNDHMCSTGKKYKDFAATLRNWFRRQKPTSAKSSAPFVPPVDRRIKDEFGNAVVTGKEGLF